MKERLFIRLGMASLFTIFLLVFVACQDKDYYDPNYLPKSGTLPSDLDFSTTRSVQFDFNGLLSEGLITAFDVYAENPYKKNGSGNWERHADVSPIAGGINVEGVSNLQRTLPMYVSELYVLPTTLFAPTVMYAQVVNNTAVFEAFDISNAVTEDATTRTLGGKSADYYLSSTLYKSGNYYKPTVSLKTETFPTAVKNAISATFVSKQKADSKYYADASIEIKQGDEKDEGAELWVSVIHSDGDYNNSLMYFCYNGDKELSELTDQDRSSLKVISAFQFAKIGTGTGAGVLKAGEYIKLKYYDGKNYVDKFPIGTKVGWILASNGFTVGKQSGGVYPATTKSSSNSNPWFYSVPSWNPEKNNKNHTISFTAQHNGIDYVCFGFEDMYNEVTNNQSAGDADCNDVMFHIISNPIKALDPPPYIPEEGTVEATETKKGILTFEDNWPKLGDYDINDVVVRYTSEITYVQNTLDGEPVGDVTMKRIADKMSIINDGADFHNAFSYKVSLSLNDLESLKVDGDDYVPVNDGDGFIIDLCADVKEEKNLPKTYSIAFNFKDGALKADDFNNVKNNPYAKAPYNPFIQPTNPNINAGVIEVHLPFYPPTGRADMNLFGKHDDASDVTKGAYYAAPEGSYYPFALHLAGVEGFVIPKEEKPIEYTYPKYTSWVENGCGLIAADWYLYPNQ